MVSVLALSWGLGDILMESTKKAALERRLIETYLRAQNRAVALETAEVHAGSTETERLEYESASIDAFALSAENGWNPGTDAEFQVWASKACVSEIMAEALRLSLNRCEPPAERYLGIRLPAGECDTPRYEPGPGHRSRYIGYAVTTVQGDASKRVAYCYDGETANRVARLLTQSTDTLPSLDNEESVAHWLFRRLSDALDPGREYDLGGEWSLSLEGDPWDSVVDAVRIACEGVRRARKGGAQ